MNFVAGNDLDIMDILDKYIEMTEELLSLLELGEAVDPELIQQSEPISEGQKISSIKKYEKACREFDELVEEIKQIAEIERLEKLKRLQSRLVKLTKLHNLPFNLVSQDNEPEPQ